MPRQFRPILRPTFRPDFHPTYENLSPTILLWGMSGATFLGCKHCNVSTKKRQVQVWSITHVFDGQRWCVCVRFIPIPGQNHKNCKCKCIQMLFQQQKAQRCVYYHPGRNYKKFLGTFYNIFPPEHFLCSVAATGLSLCPREHAKEFAL